MKGSEEANSHVWNRGINSTYTYNNTIINQTYTDYTCTIFTVNCDFVMKFTDLGNLFLKVCHYRRDINNLRIS